MVNTLLQSVIQAAGQGYPVISHLQELLQQELNASTGEDLANNGFSKSDQIAGATDQPCSYPSGNGSLSSAPSSGPPRENHGRKRKQDSREIASASVAKTPYCVRYEWMRYGRIQHSRKIKTTVPYDDGHQWRKYGTKKVNGFTFPRFYFRCTYSEEQGCQATKQVQQQNSDDPPLFIVTYTNEHTCTTESTTDYQHMADPPSEPFFLNYNSDAHRKKKRKMSAV